MSTAPPPSSSGNAASGPSSPLHPHHSPLSALFPHSRTGPKQPPRVPEKCLSWCSQQDGAPAMCRMLCLRRRAPLPTQNESLAKLRPPSRTDDNNTGSSSSKPSTKAQAQDDAAGTGFFDAWRARLAPYSLVYVKGTPEGVVGRYMEELDGDDGQYDFGSVSRHAPLSLRRKSSGQVEYFDWGDAGYLLHVPLTSLFGPLLNMPQNLERVVAPPTRFLQRYYESFTDGSQARAFGRFTEEVYKLGAVDMLGRMTAFHRRKLEEAAEAEAERRAARQNVDDVKNGVQDKNPRE